jgi:hypothetical protein
MKAGRYEGKEDGLMALVYERELPDEGPFDPPLEMKAGEFWMLAVPATGELAPLHVAKDASMTRVGSLS